MEQDKDFEKEVNGMRFTADPTGHYRKGGIDRAQVLKGCLDACGMLPFMAFGIHATIAANMEEAYQFGIGWKPAEEDTASVEDGVFKYPEDPDLYPYMKLQLIDGDQDEVYIYPYAQVCVVRDGKLVMRQRMD